MRLNIFGGPGSGTTTLGKALAGHFGWTHLDTDDFYWFTDDPLPYRRRRNPEHRRRLLSEALDRHQDWVLSGAICGWGDVFIPQIDAAIWIWAPADVRVSRIRERERLRYGGEQIEPGGELYGVFTKFCDWAAGYEADTGNIRSRAMESLWLNHLPCPVLQLEGTDTPQSTLDRSLAWIHDRGLLR
ncbi:MAG: hypothetical protein SFV52_09975 [Saprospiraceae bacterium]|nr:hypothetical protein [Saprospiraceae bacterium]